MLRYPCLVLDHDDTVVQSEATINYPYFCYILDVLRPGTTIGLEEYTSGCYTLGFIEMCKEKYGFTEQELEIEYSGWKDYINAHIPDLYPGIKDILQEHKARGGMICVVSQSTRNIIKRDYLTHIGFLPNAIYGWDLPEQQRKPNPYSLHDIMEKYQFKPSQLLVVDDMKPAWEMARAANVPIAFAGWGRKDYPHITEEMTQLCDFSFDSIEKFRSFLFG